MPASATSGRMGIRECLWRSVDYGRRFIVPSAIELQLHPRATCAPVAETLSGGSRPARWSIMIPVLSAREMAIIQKAGKESTVEVLLLPAKNVGVAVAFAGRSINSKIPEAANLCGRVKDQPGTPQDTAEQLEHRLTAFESMSLGYSPGPWSHVGGFAF